MIIQYIIVGTIVLTATAISFVRIIGFFRTPASKCNGCSGCGLKELKRV
jgi:hypothetical protein